MRLSTGTELEWVRLANGVLDVRATSGRPLTPWELHEYQVGCDAERQRALRCMRLQLEVRR